MLCKPQPLFCIQKVLSFNTSTFYSLILCTSTFHDINQVWKRLKAIEKRPFASQCCVIGSIRQSVLQTRIRSPVSVANSEPFASQCCELGSVRQSVMHNRIRSPVSVTNSDPFDSQCCVIGFVRQSVLRSRIRSFSIFSINFWSSDPARIHINQLQYLVFI